MVAWLETKGIQTLEKNGKSQKLIFPKKIDLNNNEIEIISNIKAEIEALGFIFKISNNSLEFSGIPPECQQNNLKDIIEGLIQQESELEGLTINSNDKIAKSLAISIAISDQKKLEKEEMRSLKEELLKCKSPSACPSGKPTMINLKINDLKKYFKNV